MEFKQTTKMLEEARKEHDKATAKKYKLMRNLLSGDLQTQLDQICCKMHDRDLWARVNSQVTVGRHPHLWTTFKDYLKLHKLMAFTADAAKKQRYYIQQVVRKPQRYSVSQHISCMGVLNDYVKRLTMLKDSPKVVRTI